MRGAWRSGLLLIVAALSASATLKAQGSSSGVTVSGRVQNAEGKTPIPFVTVQLRAEKDSAFVAGRLTGPDGAFTFSGTKKGVYLLDARIIGYQPVMQRVVVGELSAFLDLGALLLSAVPSTLNQVTVTGTADGVSAALDRKTFTVGDNVTQAGGSVLQALSNLPGVTVAQDGKVALRGSDKVAVLIDGKQTALTGFGAQSGLENLPASAIQSIEIINNPTARYDANASAGIINLILKKEDRDGLNGKVGLTMGAGALWEKRENLPTIRPQYRGTPKINPSVSLNYRTGPTNFFAQADWRYAPTLNKNEFATRSYDDGTVIRQQVKRNRDTDYTTVSAGVDHQFGDRNSLTISGLFNREGIIDRGDNPYFTDGSAARTRLWQFLEDEVLTKVLGSAAFTHRFTEPGHSLQFTGNYSFDREDEKYFFTNTLPDFTGVDAFMLIADQQVLDVSADYIRPLRQGRVEAGFKGRYRTIPTDMRFVPGERTNLDIGAAGLAEYREVIPALYANYVFESERIELEGGVRVEQVQLNYDVNPDHNTYESDGYRYTQPFPNVRGAYKFNDNSKLSLFFNRRVDRPNEVDIRIFPKYDEPEVIKVGNPALQPQFTTSTELGYKRSWSKGSLYAAAYHRVIDATITRIATQVPGSVLIYNVFQNAGRSWNTGSELVWEQSLTGAVSLSANANVYRNTFDDFTVVNQYPVPSTYSAAREQLVSGNLKVTARALLPQSWETSLSSVYLAPDLLPQGRIGARYTLDVGVRKSVFGGRGEIVANATDLLNTMQLRRTIRGTDFSVTSTDYYETQVVRVGYSWKF